MKIGKVFFVFKILDKKRLENKKLIPFIKLGNTVSITSFSTHDRTFILPRDQTTG
jgi:hypothetical protein